MKLDLYTGREPHIIEAEINGEKASLKIASDFTVEEIERIYELESKMSDEMSFDERWEIMYNQILIAFKRYDDSWSIEKLKASFTRKEMLKIINFITTNSFGGIPEKKEDGTATGSKKKDQTNT